MSRVRVGISQRKSPWLSPLKRHQWPLMSYFMFNFAFSDTPWAILVKQWSADPSISPTYIPSFVKSPSIDVNCGYMSCSEEETEGQGSTQRDLLESVGPFVKIGDHSNFMVHHVFANGLVTVAQIHTSASDSLGWGGVGWGGVGWGGMITSLAFPHEPDATLYDLH